VRDWRNLSQGEQEDFRGDGDARRDHFGIYDGHVSRPARIFRFAIASSRGCRWVWWSSKARNISAHWSPRASRWVWPESVDQTKLITGWEDVIEELPTSVRAELLPGETATSEQRALLVEESLAPAELSFYNLLTQHESCHMDERVERSGLTSSGVLASLFDLELKGVVRQLPGKQFLKVLL
jgi:hypothetical protein